jgi:uncharacterized membrane protein
MGNQFTKSIIVKADTKDAFRIWEDFENFPLFMKNIKKVEKTGDNISHWEVAGPGGVTLDWDAEMTRRDENKRIAWSTKDRKGDLTTSGQVTFAALPQGETEVTVTMQYEPKAGVTGDIVEKLVGDPAVKVEHDLRNFKAYVEGRHTRTD